MSYTTIKNGLVALLGSVGFTESKEAFKFDNASAHEYGNTFIIVCENGDNEEKNSETLSGRVYDVQDWVISIAFKKSANNDITSRDLMLIKKDALINVFDKPTNNTFTRLMKYKGWQVIEEDEYYLLQMKVKIVDTIIYS